MAMKLLITTLLSCAFVASALADLCVTFPPEWMTPTPLVTMTEAIAPPWLDATGTSVPSYYVEWLAKPWMTWTNNSGVAIAGPLHGQGATAFAGGVLAPNGKVVLVPINSTVVGIYDPILNSFTAGPAHGQGANAFAGGVLAPNGKVVLVPLSSTVVGIYDPILDSFTAGPAHGRGSTAFAGGVLAPNGKVVLVPLNSTVVMPIDFNGPAVPMEHCLHPVLNKL